MLLFPLEHMEGTWMLARLWPLGSSAVLSIRREWALSLPPPAPLDLNSRRTADWSYVTRKTETSWASSLRPTWPSQPRTNPNPWRRREGERCGTYLYKHLIRGSLGHLGFWELVSAPSPQLLSSLGSMPRFLEPFSLKRGYWLKVTTYMSVDQQVFPHKAQAT